MKMNKVKKLIAKGFNYMGFEIKRKQIEETKGVALYSYGKYLQANESGLNKNKRALVSYLVSPLSNPPQKIRFSNDGIALNIARALNELGYIVDIVNWDDLNFIPEKKYDLFIGHGGKNFENIYKHSLGNILWLENIYFNIYYAEKLKQFVDSARLSLRNRFLHRIYVKLRHKISRFIKLWLRLSYDLLSFFR